MPLSIGTVLRVRSSSVVRVLTLILFMATLAGCGSSRPPESADPPTSEASSGPHFTLVYHTTTGAIERHRTRTDARRVLATGVDSIGATARSPDGSMLAVSYTTADSTHLALISQSEASLRPVHAQAGSVTYSLDWHTTQNRLAFAYYAPAREGTRGPGDVLIAAADGSTTRVGCRAAREVLDWLPSGALATRDDDNIYLVAASGCATQASFDARRIHNATYSADGAHLAYIFRELEFDRATRAYVPDSALTLSDPDGTNDEVLFGDERRARYLHWAPDAAELAFTARVEDADRRQVMIYNAAQDRILFLTPPSQAPAGDQVFPRWSPSGNHLAFTLGTGPSQTAAVRVEGQTRRLGPTQGPVAGWVDDRTLVVRGSRQLRVVRLNGNDLHTMPAPAAFIHGWADASSPSPSTDADE